MHMKSIYILTIVLMVIGIISCKPVNPDINVNSPSDVNDTIGETSSQG